jgi:hypothetical protein
VHSCGTALRCCLQTGIALQADLIYAACTYVEIGAQLILGNLPICDTFLILFTCSTSLRKDVCEISRESRHGDQFLEVSRRMVVARDEVIATTEYS